MRPGDIKPDDLLTADYESKLTELLFFKSENLAQYRDEKVRRQIFEEEMLPAFLTGSGYAARAAYHFWRSWEVLLPHRILCLG